MSDTAQEFPGNSRHGLAGHAHLCHYEGAEVVTKCKIRFPREDLIDYEDLENVTKCRRCWPKAKKK